MRQSIILFTGLVFLFSCSPKFLTQDAFLLESSDRIQETQDVEIYSAYVGDAGGYITFQIDVINNSTTEIKVDEHMISMLIPSSQSGRKIVNRPIPKRILIGDLENEAKEINAEKKRSNTNSVILAGLDIASIALGGGNTADIAVYSTGTAIDISDRNSQYGSAERTIEEQLDYVDKFTLEHMFVAPGSEASFDVHFDQLPIDGLGELLVSLEDYHVEFEYEFVIKENR